MVEYVFDLWPAIEVFLVVAAVVGGFVHLMSRRADRHYREIQRTRQIVRHSQRFPPAQLTTPGTPVVVPAPADSPEALLRLPREEFRSRSNPVLKQIAEWVDGLEFAEGIATTTFGAMRGEAWIGLPGRSTTGLAKLLGRLGIGMEPDIRYPRYLLEPGDALALFRIPEETAEAPLRSVYQDSLAAAHLAALWADCGQSLRQSELAAWAAGEFELTATEALRFRAYLRWILEESHDTGLLMRPIAALPEDERAELLVRFLACQGAKEAPAALYACLDLDQESIVPPKASGKRRRKMAAAV